MASDFLKIQSSIFCGVYSHIIKAICHSNKTYTQTSALMLSAVMATQTKNMKMLFFQDFQHFPTIFGDLNQKFDIAPHEDQHQISVIIKVTVNLDLCKVLC